MKKIIIAGCVVVFGLAFAYGPNIVAENNKVNLDRKIAIEYAIKSDEMWVLDNNKKGSIAFLNISINKLIEVARTQRQNMTDTEYNELLAQIQQLKTIKEMREVLLEND